MYIFVYICTCMCVYIGNIASWAVAEGGEITAGDVLAEIETDKATMEFEVYTYLYTHTHMHIHIYINMASYVHIFVLDIHA